MADYHGGAAGRQSLDRAYFLDLLGDSHNGLGRYDAAVAAYGEAAQGFQRQGAECSYALCLFKIAQSYLSLGQPRAAARRLRQCLPLLRDLGMTRHEELAVGDLASCESLLAGPRLPGLPGLLRAGRPADLGTAGRRGPQPGGAPSG